jgi:hypothetical protein
MRAALQDGQLAIVPGTSHGLPLEKTDLVARLLLFRVDVDQLRLLSSHVFVSDPAIASLMVKLVTTT